MPARILAANQNRELERVGEQVQAARRIARVCARARIVGVGFFDYNHAQTGVAPNAIELHSVLGFACLSG
jgi:hypothetical protein